jgi:hypothetical protein
MADREPYSRLPGSNQGEEPDRRRDEFSEKPIRDPIDESNKDSFPASDPSSLWAGHDVLDQIGRDGGSQQRSS